MGVGHGSAVDRLHLGGDTVVHRLAAHIKIVATFAFVVAVAVTPRQRVEVFAVGAACVVALVALARIPVRVWLTRCAVILPFMTMAILVPLVGGGEQTEVVGVSLSVDGLWAAFNIVAKAFIGASASIVLAATTPVTELLEGFTRLRVPRVLISIVAFMIRYLDLLVGQLGRMRTAMVARAHDPRWLWQAKPIASSAGALFVRSYERGERVHQAMLARGYTGVMPDIDSCPHSGTQWWAAVVVPLPVVVTLIVGML